MYQCCQKPFQKTDLVNCHKYSEKGCFNTSMNKCFLVIKKVRGQFFGSSGVG